MLKIGDFSKLSQVTVKALRLYDDLGLFQPAHTDAATGYRYYSVTQLARLNHIIALKSMGFTLEQIGELIEQPVSTRELRGALLFQRAAITHQLEATQERLSQVEHWLTQMDAADANLPFDVVVKPTAAQWVLARRGTAAGHDQVQACLEALSAVVTRHAESVGARRESARLAIYHDTEWRDEGIDLEFAYPLHKQAPGSTLVQAYQLPGLTLAACLIHRGALTALPAAHTALYLWLAHNSYHLQGPIRELYLEWDTRGASEAVIEVQFPITK